MYLATSTFRLLRWVAAGLLGALFLAGSHSVSAGEDGPMTWQWQPYDQGLPTYALAVTVAVHPTDPAVLYAGTYEPPGLWRSADGGRSWAIDDKGLAGSPVYALRWDEVRGRWWAGTRDGLYTRAEGDTAWQATALSEHAVYALAEDENGHLYVATEDGLFHSDDMRFWEALPIAEMQAEAILALAISPDGRALVVGTAGKGLWISSDGGDAWWQAVEPGSEKGETLAQAYVSAVLLDARPGGAAYASASDRAYWSLDGGVTWGPVTGLEGRVHAFAAGPDGSLFAALTGQIARSTDGGRTWEAHGTGLRPGDRVFDLIISPDNPELIYAAAWDGIYSSSDGGQGWRHLSDGRQSWDRRTTGLGYPDVNVLAWGGQGDLLAGARAGLYRQTGVQDAWAAVASRAGRPVLVLAEAGNGRDFYAGLQGGLIRSADGGRTWSEIPSELTSHGIAGLVVEPSDPDHLHAWVAFGRVHESQDGGRNWAARWEGLGNVRPVTAIHRALAGQMYAGAEDGLFRWDEVRQAWLSLPLPLVAPTVFAVETDARAAGVVYAGATDGIWRSPDGGVTWRRWGAGLAGITVTTLALSPADLQIAFAGTRHMGLYVTGDGGATWQPTWEGRLAAASVRDILFSRDGGTVYVASSQGICRGEVHGAR